MADSPTSKIAGLLLTIGMSNKEAAVNDLANLFCPAGLFGMNPAATGGLTWGYIGGYYAGASVANGTITLTASATNYVVVNRTTRAVSVATNTTNWNDDTNYQRLYQLTVGTVTVTAGVDARDFLSGSAGGGGAVSSVNGQTGAVVLELGDIDDVDLSTLATTGQALVFDGANWVAGDVASSSPITTQGDLIIGDSGGLPDRLPIGANKKVLKSNGATASWADEPAADVTIADGGGYFTGDTVELALQELGAAGAVGSTSFHYGPTAPGGTPTSGDRWLSSTTMSLYTWVNDGTTAAWIEVG